MHTTIPKMIAASRSLPRFNKSLILVNKVSDIFKGILALPMILKLIEYSPVMDKIPASKEGICNLVCNNPVIIPARLPAIIAMNTAIIGGILFTIALAHTAAPRVNDPSLVRSDISKIR